ncbi:hypothetical protein JZ751_000977, partial [Albula glossodonta]
MAASLESITMRSTDLIKKEPLDYGGFGQVYLCHHKRFGQDGQCSLVMELIPKGNLLSMLETVNVPLPIKGRIIMEILEGMVYLTSQDIVHKDLKPENILVDKDFHIKIADLGLATCKGWSRLTREESRKQQSRKGAQSSARTAGTLSYMAPEHLESVNTASSEKSDVYSFAIVVWVVLTRQQPYENAQNDTHLSQCVRNGDRPDETLIPEDTPKEIITLMKDCWHRNPGQRPTFAKCRESFQPFYKERLEKYVEEACRGMDKYEGPEYFVETMKSLSLESSNLPSETPAPLRSSDSMPIEASIEDLNHSMESSLQMDAAPPTPPTPNSHLELKLAQELDYHKHGSYSHVDHPAGLGPRHNHASYPGPSSYPAPSPASYPYAASGDRQVPCQVSSVQSWSKEEVTPTRWENHRAQSPFTSYDHGALPISPTSSVGGSHVNVQLHHQHYHRLHSCPANPIPESEPDAAAGMCHNPGKMYPSDPGNSSEMPDPDRGSLYIQNASGIQIGHNNSMNIRGPDSFSSGYQQSCSSVYQELLLKYEDRSVREEHLDVLRENIGAQWKQCARRLGLTETEVETIDHDYARDGLNEKVYQTLERWKMKEGYVRCTVGRLCRALSKS